MKIDITPHQIAAAFIELEPREQGLILAAIEFLMNDEKALALGEFLKKGSNEFDACGLLNIPHGGRTFLKRIFDCTTHDEAMKTLMHCIHGDTIRCPECSNRDTCIHNCAECKWDWEYINSDEFKKGSSNGDQK